MKAIVYHRYGWPDVLEYVDAEKPAPGDGDVLVRVRAAAANPMDSHLTKGPLIIRPAIGLLRPKSPRLGADLAGEVEAVGRNVTRFKTGDAVFGAALGAFAEYVAVSEQRLALKPADITFEQAAGVAVGGVTALQGLRDKANLKPGQRVLINGAGGGVGTFTVQVAKTLGAEVTAVCSTGKADLVRSLGADQVIDYTREDFTRTVRGYDVMFDCVGSRSLWDCRRVMKPGGIYLPAGVEAGGRWLGPLPRLLRLMVQTPLVRQKVTFFIARINGEDLDVLKELMERGQLKPVVDRTYPLRQTAEAIRYLQQGHARGKIVITVD